MLPDVPEVAPEALPVEIVTLAELPVNPAEPPVPILIGPDVPVSIIPVFKVKVPLAAAPDPIVAVLIVRLLEATGFMKFWE